MLLASGVHIAQNDCAIYIFFLADDDGVFHSSGLSVAELGRKRVAGEVLENRHIFLTQLID